MASSGFRNHTTMICDDECHMVNNPDGAARKLTLT
jgi:hypothetical protein